MCAILRPKTTLLVLDKAFMNTLPPRDKGRLKSLYKIKSDVQVFGGYTFTTHEEAVSLIKQKAEYFTAAGIQDKQKMDGFYQSLQKR